MGGYLVVRLVPESPVDGGTFATYLDDLQLQVFDAYSSEPLSDPVYSSPYALTLWGPTGGWVSGASVVTTQPTQYSGGSGGNYGSTLSVNTVDGIPEGAYVFSDDHRISNPLIPANDGFYVTGIQVSASGQTGTVTLQKNLPGFVPAGTVLTFTAQPPASPVTSGSTPAYSFQIPASSVTSVQNDSDGLFRFEELQGQVVRASDGRHNLPYEDVNNLGATGDAPYRRPLEESRTYYRSDRLERILPLGITGALALPGQTCKLAMTPGLLAQVYHRGESHESLITDVEHVLHHEGKYVDLTGSGQRWIPSGRVFYAPHECGAREELEQAGRHFFQPRRFIDPFHYTTLIAYDRHDLSPVEGRDAVGNITTTEIDYRVLSPYRLTDANRNRSEVAFDALGLVVGTALMGKKGQRAGDSLDGFQADLDEATIVEHFAHPLHAPHSILKLATTRLVYDLFAYMRTRDQEQPQPAGVYPMARETHAADLRPGHHTKIQHVFSYSDGFQRQIQKKIQAEPGPLTDGGPDVNPRWVGSGWTIYNNKGKPVRQYEPFFSSRPSFEFAAIVGVSPILFYDPVDRVVATLHPNHTYDKIVFDPWRQETWDVNDTVLQNNPTADPDVGDFFAKLPKSDYLPTWYEQRQHGQLGREQEQAAEKTSVHANTPTVAQLDTLGRTFLTIANNRFQREGTPVDQYFATRLRHRKQSARGDRRPRTRRHALRLRHAENASSPDQRRFGHALDTQRRHEQIAARVGQPRTSFPPRV